MGRGGLIQISFFFQIFLISISFSNSNFFFKFFFHKISYGMHQPRSPYMVNERSVRILLECILVSECDCIFLMGCVRHSLIWCNITVTLVCVMLHMEWVLYLFCAIVMCDSDMYLYRSQSHRVNNITKSHVKNAVVFRKNGTV